MLILGLESSCDETGVALIDSELGLLSHAIHTQIDMHRLYGGVVPELASRDHIRRVIPLMQQVLEEAGKKKEEIDAIAVTEGPGLAGALLVGVSVAHALGLALDVPVIGVHHMEGHLLANLLADPAPEFPFMALLVSGGHTQIMKVNGFGSYELLGETLDDAVGEAFDKTAQLLGMAYPGGPAVSALADKGQTGAIELPRPMIHSPNLDMSFSGLKTAVLTAVTNAEDPNDETFRQNLARGFVDAVVDVLAHKVIKAMKALQCEAQADNLGVYLFDENGAIEAVKGSGADDYSPIPIRSLFIGDKAHGGLEAPDSNAIQFTFLPNYSDDLKISVPTDFNPLTDL